MQSIATTGLVATIPKQIVTANGVPMTIFRLASSQRKFDGDGKQGEYGPANWLTVTALWQLGVNVAASVRKGDRVVVTGRARVRGRERDPKSGMVVGVTADSIGHDLRWGTAVFSRTLSAATVRVSGGAARAGPVSPDPDAAQRSEGSLGLESNRRTAGSVAERFEDADTRPFRGAPIDTR